MGCFLGCFGGEKDQRRRKQRISRSSPRSQRKRVQNAHQERLGDVTESITDDTPKNSVSLLLTKREEDEEKPSRSPKQSCLIHRRDQNVRRESLVGGAAESIIDAPKNSVSELLLSKNEVEEKSSRSPKKKVTFSSNVTSYEHVSVNESVDSLIDCISNIEKEKQADLKSSNQSHLRLPEDENSVTSSVASYPPNHRYHNARDSDDEFEEDDEDDLDEYDDDDYEDYDEDFVVKESVITESMESRVGNSSTELIHEEIESRLVVNGKVQPTDEEIKAFRSRMNARGRSDYINSVLNPVENISQWKAVKSKGTNVTKPPQKENLNDNFEAHRLSFSLEPEFKTKNTQPKTTNQEIAVDTSLSTWLASPEIKKTFSQDSSPTSMRNFEDRPILGALTIEELRQVNSMSSSPRKSPCRSPDDMPIIGSVGSYWNHSASSKHSDSNSSYKGIPNTTSKYREDKRVNWHTTPFEKRLDRALNRGAAEA